MFNFHVALTRDQARRDVEHGLLRWHNEYNVDTLQRPGLEHLASTADAIDFYADPDAAAGVIGTPDDLIENILRMQEITGGFGVMMGFVNDWAEPEAMFRSWDLVARHVVPAVNGQLASMQESNQFVIDNREYFDRAGQAILSKIFENERAAAALKGAGTPKSGFTPRVGADTD